MELYTKKTFPGLPIPINVEPLIANDTLPGDMQIRAAAKRLRNGRTGGISGIWAKDIKAWMGATIAVEQGDPPLGGESAGDR